MSPFEIDQIQPHAWSILANSFRSQRVASTYLLHGPEGIGQWLTALNFAALLNCEAVSNDASNSASARPCGDCRPCRTIFTLNHEGLHIIVPVPPHKNKNELAMEMTSELLAIKKAEPFARIAQSSANSIPISLAREVAVRLSRKNTPGIRRVVLFYRMDQMRMASADALLKLIEEPPDDTVILLTADRPDRLPRTIQSRAQKIRLNRLPESFIRDYLEQKYELDPARSKLVSRLSQGILGHAIEMATHTDEDDISRRETTAEMFDLIMSGRANEAVTRLMDTVSSRDKGEAEATLRLWQTILRDCHYLFITNDCDGLTNIDLLQVIKRGAARLAGSASVLVMASQIKNALADLERNVHIHTALAALAFRMSSTASTS